MGAWIIPLWGELFVKKVSPSPEEQGIPPDSKVLVEGQVYRKEQKESYQLLYLKNNSIDDQKTSIQESKLILYDSQRTNIKTGNWIQASGKLFFFEEDRNPGNFNQKFYYQKQNIRAGMWTEQVQVTDTGVWAVRETLAEFRSRWQQVLLKLAGEEDGGILCAMILGEKAGMDAEIKELYQKTGIAHILAISGLHLSLIGTGIYQFFRRRTGSYFFGGVAGMLFLLLYILMIGMSVSAFRATCMFLMRVGADMSGRVYDMLTALSLAAVAVLLWRPLSYFDGGFQMSFGAILGICLSNYLMTGENQAGKKQKWMRALGASLGIQAVLLPVTLYHYFEFPMYSIFLNLLIIPLMSILLVCGMAGSLAGFLAEPLGQICMVVCRWILDFYEWICRISMKLPGSHLVTGRPGMESIVFYYLCLCLFVLSVTCLKGRKQRCCEWILAVMGITVLCAAGQVEKRGHLEVTVLDVGQGDGICIRGDKGEIIFVDGGSSDTDQVGRYRIEPFLKSQGIRRIDYALVTHGDGDHFSGIQELLERQEYGVQVECLVLPPQRLWEEKLMGLAALAQDCGTQVAVLEGGQKMDFGKLEMTCLHPDENYYGEPGNEASLVLNVGYGEFDLLLTGDVEGEGEKMLTEKLSKPCDVLKVAHHGSKNSTMAAFLKKAAPMEAIISAGVNNRYGHPHPETIERLEEAGCHIRKTPTGGAITIETDGRKMEIREYLKEK